MTETILTSELRTARKNYECDATALFHDYLCNSGMGRNDLTPDHQLLLDAAEADKGSILPGQMYYYQCGVDDGRMYTWRSRPGMQSVCQAHELFEE